MPPVSTIPSSHAVYGLNVFLLIEETGEKFPVVSATLEYALNQIPVASVVVPVGLKVSKDSEPDINSLVLKDRTKARVVVSGVGKPHPNGVNAYPTSNIKDEVLFEGYVTAVHNHLSVGSVSTTIILFSWLQDLDISALSSGDFVKSTPADWFSFDRQQIAINTETLPYYLGSGVPSNNNRLKKLDIAKVDWWEEIFKPGIEFRISQPLNRFLNLSGTNRQINQFVSSAISRIFSNGRLTLNSVASNGLMSSINMLGEIGKLFTNVIMREQGGSSAFEKLVSLGREFRFVIAPSIQYANLMEYNPVGPATHYLKENEFDFGASTPNPTVVPSAVIVHGNTLPGKLVQKTPSDNSKVDIGFIGQYPNPVKATGIATGPFLVIPAPSWMYSVSGTISTFTSTKGIAITPDVQYTSQGRVAARTSSTDFRKFADAYAAAAYFDALFAAKSQDVICGFRTDIEPGHCLHVEFSKNGNKKFEKRGIVNSVIYSFSGGQNPNVSTTYKLKHVFDSEEAKYFNFDPKIGLPHSLFVGL